MPWSVIFFVLCGAALILLILLTKISLEFRGAAGSKVSPWFYIHIKAGPIVLFRFHFPRPAVGKKKQKRKKIEQKDILFLIKKHGKSVEIKQLQLRGSVGIGEANVTAIGVGIIYALLGSTISLADNHFNLKKCDLNLTPVYNSFGFFLQGHCIVRLKIVNIIHAVFTAWRLRIIGRK